MLLEPSDRPAAVGVKIAFLLGEHLVENLVDERQRLAYGEGLASRVEHPRVAGVYRHAGADGGLGEVDRRDVARLQEAQRLWQFRTERGQILAARRGTGASAGTGAADEDDAGGEGVGTHTDHPVVRVRFASAMYR